MSASPTPAPSRAARVGSIGAAVRLMDALGPGPADPVARKRRLVAELCRILGDQLGGNGATGDGTPAGGGARSTASPGSRVPLSPRMRQTLERLLAGDSEKQIAARLGLSRHTVHVYVKSLYQRFDVNSRGELFAKFVRRG